jgi:hypothetical protein
LTQDQAELTTNERPPSTLDAKFTAPKAGPLSFSGWPDEVELGLKMARRKHSAANLLTVPSQDSHLVVTMRGHLPNHNKRQSFCSDLLALLSV